MQRFSNSALVKNMNRHLLFNKQSAIKVTRVPTLMERPCEVFINHRGIDTKKNIAGLLFQYLSLHQIDSFLDSKNMKPGDRLFDNINRAIHGCKVGVAVLSPRYCDSMYCLHELALMMEMKKRVIPIFYDVKPSQLGITNACKRTCSTEELERYGHALTEARNIVGLTFDPSKEDWSKFLRKATDAVIKNLIEVEEDWLPSIPNRIMKKMN